MSADAYLKAVLESQGLDADSDELQQLEAHFNKVTEILRDAYGPGVRLMRGGSLAKGTLILESYDLDVPCLFQHDDTAAGETLEEIADDVARTLSDAGYWVERKRSALRLRDQEDRSIDFHIDVVPARYVDGSETDAYLHQNEGEKSRLKTNPAVHLEHVRDSGVVDAIRLLKLWNCRHGLNVKTFVLELLAVKLLEGHEEDALTDQLVLAWEIFRDRADSLAIEDPANSNNDISFYLDDVRSSLSSAATSTLDRIDALGWESVFGEVDEEQRAERAADVATAAAAVKNPHRTWGSGGNMD